MFKTLKNNKQNHNLRLAPAKFDLKIYILMFLVSHYIQYQQYQIFFLLTFVVKTVLKTDTFFFYRINYTAIILLYKST